MNGPLGCMDLDMPYIASTRLNTHKFEDPGLFFLKNQLGYMYTRFFFLPKNLYCCLCFFHYIYKEPGLKARVFSSNQDGILSFLFMDAK